jgi:predicted nucleotidyltransferase
LLDGYPIRLREALSRLTKALEPLAPEPAALVVYGSVAKGTYRERESDVNVALVLHDAAPPTLYALGEPLRVAHREVRLKPFVVEKREIARLADAFPVKLADIRDAHHVLLGEDPFTDVVIEREHLRIRVEQELRNHLLRLRRQAIFSSDAPHDLARAIYVSAAALAFELGALLDVAGHPRPKEKSARAILRAAGEAFDLDRPTLDRLCDVRDGASIDDPSVLYEATLMLTRAAVEIADRMETAGMDVRP